RVVKLDGDFLRKCAPVSIALPESPHEICERAGDEKILLHEAQSLPHASGIIGIQYPRQRLCFESFSHCTDELTMAECLKVEVIGRSRGPEPECIDRLSAVAHHRAIVGYADQTGGLAGDRAQGTLTHLERAVQLNFHLLPRT